jgi:cytochrome c oxidase subunit II
MNQLASASSYAAQIDNLIVLVTVLIAFFFTLTTVMFFWLIWRFRARPGVKSQYIQGDEQHIKKWINRPHVLVLICDVIIIVFAMKVWHHIKQQQPPAEARIRVIGQQWAWVFQYPGADGQFDTGDDFYTSDHLYVENNKTYHFELRSRDVIHDFSVPAFRLKQDAIPGRTITGWFRPTLAGTYDIQCAEICGLGHGVMYGRIHVQDAEDHNRWVAERTAAVASAQ